MNEFIVNYSILFKIIQYVSIPRWFQSTCCKIIHRDVITGADDTWRHEAVNIITKITWRKRKQASKASVSEK